MSTTSPHPVRPDSPAPVGQRYVLPCHPLHHGGLYEYVLLTVAQAREWFKAGPWVSYVTHPEWLWMLRQILAPLHGRPPDGGTLQPALTPLPVLDYADEALIFLPDGWDVPGYLWNHDRAHCARLVAQEAYTLGLLRRLA